VTLVFFSDIAWDSLHQRPQHLAMKLSQTMRVLWVEPVTLGRRVVLSPVELAPDLYRMMVPAFPLTARNRWIRRIAVITSRLRVLREAVARVQRVLLGRGLRRIRPAGDHTVCLVENFQLMPIVDAVKPLRIVFDYIDDVFGFATFPAFVRSEWLAALERADAITVTSPTLRKRILDIKFRDVRIIRNGVEFRRFADPADTHRPADLPPPGSTVVGYVGSIYPWLDFGLLDRTIGTMTDLSFVMVGPLHPAVAREMARLVRHRNFSFLGLKPYEDVPAYMRNLDVAIIPFKRTLLTEGVNPVKLYEYSAVGVPTVATDFSDDTRDFARIVLIARTEAEFAAHIRTAIRRHADREFTRGLSSFAAENDWDSRAQEFSALLQPEGH
jgi:glycosyltransferase involved in cell wall biosynthesis